jgi:hypothetical protein
MAAPLDGSAPDGSVAAALAFQMLYPQTQGDVSVVFQCLPGPLPLGDNGLPNCVVVTAQSSAPRTAEQLAACRACDAPGLEPFTSSLSLDAIGEGLSNYQCICAVTPSPASAGCPPAESSSAGWCYATKHDLPVSCAPRPGPILGFAQGTSQSGALYVACF